MNAARVELTVGRFVFRGRLEANASPRSVELLKRLLPLQRTALHACWSGESGWVPLQIEARLPIEHALARPLPGQVLLYAGEISEPEILIPYGACAFACRHGALAGNHVITLDADEVQMREMGTALLWHGAQTFRLS